MKKIVFLAVFIAALLPVAAVHAGEAASPDITGTWKSAQPEDLKNGTFGVRHFVFEQKRWAVTFIRYADRELQLPLYSFYGEGTFELKGPSQKVPGAYNGVFVFSRKFITLLTDDEGIIRKYRLQECGFNKYVPKDITEKGCSFFRSVSDYSVEYDLVKRDDNTLFLGARPADGNMGTEDRRPVFVGEPLKKSTDPGAGAKPGVPAPVPASGSPPSPGKGQ